MASMYTMDVVGLECQGYMERAEVGKGLYYSLVAFEVSFQKTSDEDSLATPQLVR